VRQHARRTAGGLSQAQLDWQHAPRSWSVGQCLEHLVITHERYQPEVPRLLAAARARGAPPVYQPWGTTFFGRFLLKGVTPGSRPVRTGKVFTPAVRARPAVLDVFERQLDELERWMEAADGLDLTRIRLSSPMLKLIRYNMGEALEIVVVHAERHLQQADRVKQQAGFPST
jgi:hypothetical protein